MKIHIENYKNIRNLEFEFSPEKVNIVYGLSGSGKSSIREVFTGVNLEENITFGSSVDSQKIEIVPTIEVDEIERFDEENKRLFLESKNGNELYRVLFSGDEDITSLYNSMMDSFSNLTKLIPQINAYLDKIKKLRSDISLRGNAKSIDHSKSIADLESEINSNDYNSNLYYVRQYGLQRLKWIKEGTTFDIYKNGKCPFCNKKIIDSRKSKIDYLSSLTADNFKIIFESNDIMQNFDIDSTNISSKRGLSKLKKYIQKILDSKKELDDLLDFINNLGTKNPFYNRLEPIHVSSFVKNNIPGLEESVKEYNTNITDANKKMRIFRSKTNKIVKKNMKVLNSYLDIFGIPYEFILKEYDVSTREVTTWLQHLNSDGSLDNRSYLSSGEKNIVSLLLFLLSTEKKIIIIDDPVSSFDDNRRTLIYDIILEKLKGKTVILLSHEDCFVRNAAITLTNRGEKKDSIGKIYYLQSTLEENKIEEIDINDFKNFFDHVKDFLKNNWDNIPYYQKIINLRILAEGLDRKSNKKLSLIYQYLSIIMHADSKGIVKDEIKLELEKLDSSEKEVLDLIHKQWGFQIENVPDNIMCSFNYEVLSNFEKVICMRERFHKNSKNYKELKKYSLNLLSEIVHLNENKIICLNPYKYSVYPNNIIKIIKEYK